MLTQKPLKTGTGPCAGLARWPSRLPAWLPSSSLPLLILLCQALARLNKLFHGSMLKHLNMLLVTRKRCFSLSLTYRNTLYSKTQPGSPLFLQEEHTPLGVHLPSSIPCTGVFPFSLCILISKALCSIQ